MMIKYFSLIIVSLFLFFPNIALSKQFDCGKDFKGKNKSNFMKACKNDIKDKKFGNSKLTIPSKVKQRFDKCLKGYVFREAFKGDNICVVPYDKNAAKHQNMLHAERSINSKDECPEGLVPREIKKSDRLCVTQQEKNKIVLQNTLHKAKNLAIGKNCRDGYVFREGVKGDDICVTPNDKLEVQTQNSQKDSKKASHKIGTCLEGFVYREAGANDRICVTQEEKDKAKKQNDEHIDHIYK